LAKPGLEDDFSRQRFNVTDIQQPSQAEAPLIGSTRPTAPSPATPAPRQILLGVRLDPLTIEELNLLVKQVIQRGAQLLIGGHNLHSVYLFHHDPRMRSYFERADVIRIDGMSLVLWGRLVGKRISRERRVTYLDWIKPLMKHAASEGWRVYYLGGKRGVAAQAAELLRREVAGLNLDTHHGYFTETEIPGILDQIRQFQPQVLMVGMGMPRQEHWVMDHLDRLDVNVILTVGACFDYLAGAIPTPPRWMGRVGLEWLYRLVSEPRRLWKRYLLEPWSLLPIAFRDLLARRRGGGRAG